MPKPLWTDQDEPVPIRPLTFKERFALFAEAMWLGILVPLLSLALVTWLAALAAAVASLRRHLGARSDSFGLLWADFLTAVRGAWLPTLVVDALLVLALFNSRLAQLGLVPGGPVLMWLTVAAALLVLACCVRTAAMWSSAEGLDGKRFGVRGWFGLLRGGAEALIADPFGLFLLLLALGLCCLFVWMLPILIVFTPGLMALAAVAVAIRVRNRLA